MQDVEVEILGSIYRFSTDDPAYLDQITSHLKIELEKLKDEIDTIDRSKILVLYCMQLTEKYLAEKNNASSLLEENKKIDHLLDDIEII